MAQVRLTCIIKPFRLDAVMAALEKIEVVEEILVVEVRGYGRQKGHLDLYRGSEYDLTFLPKVCLEIYLRDRESVEPTLMQILQNARTGRIGDGKVFQVALADENP